MTKYKEFLDQGYDIYDPNSPYYTDRCIPILKNSSKTTILSRREEFDNITIECGTGCIFNGINTTTGYLNCQCLVKINSNEIGLNIYYSSSNKGK